MEYSATKNINQKWYYCTIFSFLCFLFICVYRDNTQQQKASITAMVLMPNNSSVFSSISDSSDTNWTYSPSTIQSSPFRNSSYTDATTVSSKTIISNWNVNELKEEKCDIFDGEWIWDSKNSPIYRSDQCPFLSDQVKCQKNGRPDSGYEHWRWQPKHCDIPRFNATRMLERMRGKRIAIIGDSLNRNQWESLACLLYSSIQPWRAIVDVQKAGNKFLKILDYDFILEFYWSPFLVKVEQLRNGSKVLQLHKLDQPTKFQNADVMVFNSGHWWTHRGRSKTWSFYKHFGKLMVEMEEYSAFEIGMKTWARWVEKKVNPNKTTVFFRSYSPEHKKENLHWCYNQTQPITNEKYKQSFPASMVSIVEETIKSMKIPVKHLNITHLSAHRRDAHTSVYTVRQGKLLTDNERKQPALYADCSHWCLPGLPDTWNALLYSSLIEDFW